MTIKDVTNASPHTKGVNSNYVEENQLQIKTNKEDYSEDKKNDSVDISKEARKLVQTMTNLKTLVSEMPDVRSEKIEEFKAKIKDGFYERPEVILQVAEKIIDIFGNKK
ncbi:MAG: flagellar biosynthesis protein FlgM [Candidatus Brocadia sp. WS118]|nr:MAG: flagellar biosynthesis protein FlgM [Candidatus Brocadia sp. WS118]